jgi:hypothetical protein
MSIIIYRCPTTREQVRTSIETSKDTLVKMREMDLSIWVWCQHCMVGHQINPSEATLEDEKRKADALPWVIP